MPTQSTAERGSLKSTQAEEGQEWTCARCEMTVRFLPGAEKLDLPANWEKHNGQTFCLTCRRARAVEAAVSAAGETRGEQLAKMRTAALVEFEIKRDPDRANGVIARACRSSVMAVAKARERLAA